MIAVEDRPRDRLRPAAVVRAACSTYRARFARVAGTAFVVFGTVAVVDVAVTVLAAEHVSRPLGAAVTLAIGAVFSMVGVVVYAGIVDRVVGTHRHGHAEVSLHDTIRSIPLGRLIVADVVLALATLVGLALFVVPGILIFTAWVLVGPVIAIERLAVKPALRRSAHLVRTHFWLTLLLVTLPIQVEQAVLHWIHYEEVFGHPLVPALVLNGVLGMTVGAIVGLVEVVLTDDLIDEDAARAASRSAQDHSLR